MVRLILGGTRFIAEPFDDHRGKGYRFTATGSYRHLGVKGLEAITVGYTGQAAREQPYDGATRDIVRATPDISVAGTITTLRP